ncbi:MAG: Tm-1-like ATP-binding domain-containing protein [Chloroflexota bacterium]|nr:Tm-1-like ATP-binding domain-containing protein [Chloroflexota bacterium]
MKTIVLVGALDTKGEAFACVKALIERAGHRAYVVDFGVMGAPMFTPDLTRAEVASAVGADLDMLNDGSRKDDAMRIMADGLAVVVRRLYDAGDLDGILGMGGGGGTSIACAAMRTLPVGVPKLILSTMVGDIAPFVGTSDITFMPSVIDVAGLNRISRRIYANAAGAIIGMVNAPPVAADESRPLLAASMFGNTTQAVMHAAGILEAAGYEVLVFHATGTGGRTMEALITDGQVSGVFDLTTTEIADTVCGGVLDAGADRLWAAPRAGIPTILAPGCVDMANFGAIETVPARYQHRNLYQWNPNVTLLRTNADENRRMGAMIATAANAAPDGTVAVLLPLGGVSMLDSPGGRFWDADADAACFEAIGATLRPGIPLIEIDANINDPVFSGACARTLLSLMEKKMEKKSS